MFNRNYIPRAPSGSNNEARRFIDTHSSLYPARRPMPMRFVQTPFAASAGSYQGNYDNTKQYNSGDWVRVLTPVTISGIAVPAGVFAVPPGVTVPANGTAFQVPQYPEPTAFGATPSDKVYWHVTQLSCDSLL